MTTFLTLGYYLGENWKQIAEAIHHYLLYVSIATSRSRGRCATICVKRRNTEMVEPKCQTNCMAFMGKLVGDLGAMTSIGPMLIGEKLGLYKALSKADR